MIEFRLAIGRIGSPYQSPQYEAISRRSVGQSRSQIFRVIGCLHKSGFAKTRLDLTGRVIDVLRECVANFDTASCFRMPGPQEKKHG